MVQQPVHPMLRTGTDKLPILNKAAQPGPPAGIAPPQHSCEGLNTPSVWRSAVAGGGQGRSAGEQWDG